MTEKNSGKIYVFPLNSEMGFGLCRFMDYTDIAPFDGALVYILNKRLENINALPTIEEISTLKVLFGPVPLNKYINVKGKGAWKFVGSAKILDKSVPAFKDTNQIITLQKATDWSSVGGWRKRYFNKGDGPFEYEEVRHLEMLELYNMRNVEIRATMHFLLLNGLKVEKYYDMKDDNNRSIYLQMLNTSFDKKTAKKYSSVLEK